MILDDFNVYKLNTKYQRLRFVIVILVGLISGFLIWKSRLAATNFSMRDFDFRIWDWNHWYYDYESFQNYRKITSLIGAIICAFLGYYSFKVWEWINKEDKL